MRDIEVVGRLVEQHQLPLLGECPRQVGALLFATREGLPVPGQQMLDPGAPRGIRHDFAVLGVGAGPAAAVRDASQIDDVLDGDVLVRGRLLLHHRYPLGDLRRCPLRVGAVAQDDLPGPWLDGAGQHTQQRRLARPVRSEQSQDPAGHGWDADAVHDDGAAGGPGQIFCF